jgi:hypothetical protein
MPGNYQSASKRRSRRTRKGSKWLRATPTESGNAAARTKDLVHGEKLAPGTDPCAALARQRRLLTLAKRLRRNWPLRR